MAAPATLNIDNRVWAFTWSHGPVSEPLVALHGLGDSAINTFAPVWRDSPLNDTPTLFIDFPGFGLAHPVAETEAATVEGYADGMATLLRTLAVTPRAVFGHSLGGSIAIDLATRYPELVPALIVAEALLLPENSVLANSIAKRPENEFVARGFAMLRRATRRQAMRNDAAAIAFERTLAHTNPKIMHQLSNSLVRDRQPSFEEMLVVLAISRTYLIGEHTEAKTSHLERAGVEIIRVAQSGHSMISEAPSATTRGILTALEGI